MKRRVSLLLALVALVIWLVTAEPTETGGEVTPPWFYSRASAQDSCCTNPGETDPHDECVGNSCMSVSGCGVSDCSACSGCDPNEEATCFYNNGTWDPNSCTCSYGCDPYGSAEEACYYEGGTWDPYSCTCTPWQCNAGAPIQYEYSWDCSYCDEWSGDWMDCTCYDYYYEVYCEDGTLVSSWWEPGNDVCVRWQSSCS